MQGHARKCVDKYCELADVNPDSLKQVTTPNIDDNQLLPHEFEEGKIILSGSTNRLDRFISGTIRSTRRAMDGQLFSPNGTKMERGM